MSKILATGSQFAIGSTFGTTQSFTGATNATESVLTFGAAHGLLVGDIVHIVTSGWGLLANRVVRIRSVPTTTTATLENVNTSNVYRFPAGAGAGTLRSVTAWTPITQVADIASAGGEQNFADASDMDDTEDRQIPSSRSAETLTLTVHHNPALPWVPTVDAAEGLITPFRIVYPSAARMLAAAYVTRKRTATIARGETIKSTVTMTYAAAAIEYAT